MAYGRPPHTEAWIRTGPGAEWTTEESREPGHEGATEKTTDFVYRLGVGYTMELGGGIGLSPQPGFRFRAQHRGGGLWIYRGVRLLTIPGAQNQIA